jgi:hypothetical protein
MSYTTLYTLNSATNIHDIGSIIASPGTSWLITPQAAQLGYVANPTVTSMSLVSALRPVILNPEIILTSQNEQGYVTFSISATNMTSPYVSSVPVSDRYNVQGLEEANFGFATAVSGIGIDPNSGRVFGRHIAPLRGITSLRLYATNNTGTDIQDVKLLVAPEGPNRDSVWRSLCSQVLSSYYQPDPLRLYNNLFPQQAVYVNNVYSFNLLDSSLHSNVGRHTQLNPVTPEAISIASIPQSSYRVDVVNAIYNPFNGTNPNIDFYGPLDKSDATGKYAHEREHTFISNAASNNKLIGGKPYLKRLVDPVTKEQGIAFGPSNQKHYWGIVYGTATRPIIHPSAVFELSGSKDNEIYFNEPNDYPVMDALLNSLNSQIPAVRKNANPSPITTADIPWMNKDIDGPLVATTVHLPNVLFTRPAPIGGIVLSSFTLHYAGFKNGRPYYTETGIGDATADSWNSPIYSLYYTPSAHRPAIFNTTTNISAFANIPNYIFQARLSANTPQETTNSWVMIASGALVCGGLSNIIHLSSNRTIGVTDFGERLISNDGSLTFTKERNSPWLQEELDAGLPSSETRPIIAASDDQKYNFIWASSRPNKALWYTLDVNEILYQRFLTSSDYGQTWQVPTLSGVPLKDNNGSPLVLEINDIAMSYDGKYQYAAGRYSQQWGIYSRDYGVTWSSLNVPTVSALDGGGLANGEVTTTNSIATNSTGQYITVTASERAVDQGSLGNSGRMYTSNDFGATWIQGPHARWRGVAMSSDGQKQVAAADRHIIPTRLSRGVYRSNNWGATWSSVLGIGTLSALTLSDYNTVDVDPTVFQQNITFNTIAMDRTGAYITAIVSQNIMFGYERLSYTYVVARSINGGDTWTTQTITEPYVAVGIVYNSVNLSISPDGKLQTLRTHTGKLYTSNNYGETWLSVGTPGKSAIYTPDESSLARAPYGLTADSWEVSTQNGFAVLSPSTKRVGLTYPTKGRYANVRRSDDWLTVNISPSSTAGVVPGLSMVSKFFESNFLPKYPEIFLFVNPSSSAQVPLTGWQTTNGPLTALVIPPLDNSDRIINGTSSQLLLTGFLSNFAHQFVYGNNRSLSGIPSLTTANINLSVSQVILSSTLIRKSYQLVDLWTDLDLTTRLRRHEYMTEKRITSIEQRAYAKVRPTSTPLNDVIMPPITTPPPYIYITPEYPYNAAYGWEPEDIAEYASNVVETINDTPRQTREVIILDGKAFISPELVMGNQAGTYINAGTFNLTGGINVSNYSSAEDLPQGPNGSRLISWNRAASPFPRIVGNPVDGIGKDSFGDVVYWALQTSLTGYSHYTTSQYDFDNIWLSKADKTPVPVYPLGTYMAVWPGISGMEYAGESSRPKFYYGAITANSTSISGAAAVSIHRINAYDFSTYETYAEIASRYTNDYLLANDEAAYATTNQSGEEAINHLTTIGYL